MTSFLLIRCMYANLYRVRLLPVLLLLRDPLRRGDFYFAALLRIEQRKESHSVAARDRHRYAAILYIDMLLLSHESFHAEVSISSYFKYV